MAGILIDTSVLVDAERDSRVLEQLPEDARHAISVITVSELLHGVHRAAPDPVRIRRQVVVEALLGAIEQLPITPRIARLHAQIWAELQAKGEIIGAHNLWIAATALAHGLMLATANAGEFKRVPALELLPIKS
ncbi:MAG TPA: PIN domain-containing protein [Solirubrobacteraceae bacterium]|nr:PIN domain-containing protein [Solirubrobacteraceae bacterium]